jgi:peptidylprolyl isomerase
MSIARFALRGVVADDGVRFLLRYAQPGSDVRWQAVYALQRIGNHPETGRHLESLRLLSKSDDPLVRMNLATLLGRLGDSGGAAEVLQRLADHDADWRVRVNAFRALGNFSWKGNASVITTFRRAFFDANEHVSLTAISTYPSVGVDSSDTLAAARDALQQLAYIAENRGGGFGWNLQAQAASAAVALTGELPRGLRSPSATIHPAQRARLLRAAGRSRDPAARAVLVAASYDPEPMIACAALEGLQELSHRNPGETGLRDSVYSAAVRLLTGRDVAVVATSSSLLGDSLFLRTEAVRPLLETLAQLRPPHDTEAMQEILATLGKIGDSRDLRPMIDQLSNPDPSVATAAASALKHMTGNDYSDRIQRRAEPLYVDMDFAFLRALPPIVRVVMETSRGDILIDLDRDLAPFTVMSFIKLAEQRGFYRGLTFHRIVPNFVVQGGDPRGDGWGGPGYAIRSEFSAAPYETGTVGMASAGKDTEGSQFFITHSPQPHLDGKYTVVGRVAAGMEVVTRLQVDDRLYDMVVRR